MFYKNGAFAFLKVAELKDNDYFGELALQFEMQRTASIVCKEDTHFAVLCKKDYD